jgi:hypothetical protein
VRRKSSIEDPLKEATIEALKQVLEPLLELMLYAGVTVRELDQLARKQAVLSAKKHVVKESGRDSKSRVAIMTGLSRSEVARISKLATLQNLIGQHSIGKHPARRVLEAWHNNPRFLSPLGKPAVLPVFGERRSFERLVEMYGRGFPVRAMLDELIQTDLVECTLDQRVRAKSPAPILTARTRGAIAAVGERGRDLLGTLVSNVRGKAPLLFEATAEMESADQDTASLIRVGINEHGARFVDGVRSLLLHRSKNQAALVSTVNYRLGATVYYFQRDYGTGVTPSPSVVQLGRKNLRRRQTASRDRKKNQKPRPSGKY